MKNPVQGTKVKGKSDDATPYKVALSKLAHIRTEMARCYRQCRSGEISSKELSRFTYCLRLIGQVIEAESFEQRIEAMERRMNERA